ESGSSRKARWFVNTTFIVVTVQVERACLRHLQELNVVERTIFCSGRGSGYCFYLAVLCAVDDPWFVQWCPTVASQIYQTLTSHSVCPSTVGCSASRYAKLCGTTLQFGLLEG